MAEQISAHFPFASAVRFVRAGEASRMCAVRPERDSGPVQQCSSGEVEQLNAAQHIDKRMQTAT